MKQRNFLRLRHAKAHDNGALKNPFFFRAQPKRWMIMLSAVLVIFGIVGGGIGLTYVPIFQLSNVAVQGTNTLNPEAIASFVRQAVIDHNLPLCSQTNAYTVRTSAIESAVLAHFSVDRVTVERNGASLVITVEEKVTTIALRTKEKTAMLDLTGAYVRDATAEESRAIDLRIGIVTANADEGIVPLQTDMPIVIDTQNDAVSALSTSAATAIVDISNQIGTVGFHAVTYTLEGLDAPFVRVDTDAQYDLYFDLFARPIDEQIRALQAIVNADGFTAPNEYIDLRFGAYVYMK